jgi:hypothetical protein
MAKRIILIEFNVFNMFSHKYSGHIGSLIPGRLIFHGITNRVAILTLPKVFEADIFETDIPDQVIISGIKAHASLVIQLGFLVIEDIQVDVI